MIRRVMRTAVAETNFLKGGKVGNCSGSNKADEGSDFDDSFCAEDLDCRVKWKKNRYTFPLIHALWIIVQAT